MDSPNDGFSLEVDSSEGDDLVHQPVVAAHLLLLLGHDPVCVMLCKIETFSTIGL